MINFKPLPVGEGLPLDQICPRRAIAQMLPNSRSRGIKPLRHGGITFSGGNRPASALSERVYPSIRTGQLKIPLTGPSLASILPGLEVDLEALFVNLDKHPLDDAVPSVFWNHGTVGVFRHFIVVILA